MGGRVCIVALVSGLFYSTLCLRDLVSGTTELNFMARESKKEQAAQEGQGNRRLSRRLGEQVVALTRLLGVVERSEII